MQNGKGEAVVQYKKTNFQAGVIIPDAPDGEWEVTVLRDKTTVKPDKNGSPMVSFSMRLDTAAEEENEHAQGSTLAYRVFFLDDLDPKVQPFRKNRAKVELAVLASNCGFDLDIIPSNIGGDEPSDESVKEDLAAFIEAVEGKSFTIWTLSKPDAQGKPMVNISLTKPGKAFAGPVSKVDADEDDAPAKKSSKKGSKKS